jgi:hypothetical protein
MAADRREELLNTRDDLAKHRDGAGERAFHVHAVVRALDLQHVRRELANQHAVPVGISGAADKQHRCHAQNVPAEIKPAHQALLPCKDRQPRGESC